jgi:hypothetical protein
MGLITLEATNLCSYTDDQRQEYTLYSGSIASVSDVTGSELSAEPLNGGANKVELDSK